jgi:hypothetical protein
MRFFRHAAVLFCVALGRLGFAQGAPAEAVRVTVTLNADGSRTTYRFDDAHHTASASTKTREGKLLGKARYTLDDAGHFATGEIYGPDSNLRFKSVYKYDGAGRQTQEVQSDKNDNVLHKIVYAYDSLGKPTGYAVYDGAGKLVGQTTAPTRSSSPTKKKSR